MRICVVKCRQMNECDIQFFMHADSLILCKGSHYLTKDICTNNFLFAFILPLAVRSFGNLSSVDRRLSGRFIGFKSSDERS